MAKRRDLVREEAILLATLLHEYRTLGNPVFTDTTVVRFQTEGYCQVLANGSLVGVADEVIKREIAHHRSIGRSFEWKLFSTDLPADLLDRLVARGFEIGTKEVVCAVDLATCFREVDPEIRVERVSDEIQLNDFRSVAEAVFGKDFSFTVGVLARCIAAGTEEEVGFVAYSGDTPVSIGRLDHGERNTCGGLYTGGTLPEFRCRGYYQAVVAARVSHARKASLRYLCIDARPTSLPILHRLGFESVVESWQCCKTN